MAKMHGISKNILKLNSRGRYIYAGAIPCLALGARITPPPALFLNKPLS